MQKELMQKFYEIFGNEGDVRSYFAPGRVNLIGEHTDYNGGHVFPCALTIGTYGIARKREDRKKLSPAEKEDITIHTTGNSTSIMVIQITIRLPQSARISEPFIFSLPSI